MPSGAGFAPAGTSPAGYGLTDAAPVANTHVLPDWVTSQTQSGRFVDQNTGDYAFTSDGRVKGMSTAQQLVLLALSAAPFKQLQDKGPNFQRQVATIVQNALAPYIRQKIIALDSVSVNDIASNPDGSTCLIKWRDLTTGTEQTTVV